MINNGFMGSEGFHCFSANSFDQQFFEAFADGRFSLIFVV